MVRLRPCSRAREAGARRPGGHRPPLGFSLVETLIALVLLGFSALAAASAEGWAARMTALAEAREEGASAAELVLDSLAALSSPAAGARAQGDLRLDWTVVPRGAGLELRLRVRTARAPGAAWYGALAATPPDTLGAAP